jgi:RING finger and CHY zinc finger domain-containing protein 1
MQHAADGGADAGRECKHYSRGCRVMAPCCGMWVGCRLCHNEQFTDHEIDRHAIRTMQCLSCDTEQPVRGRSVNDMDEESSG